MRGRIRDLSRGLDSAYILTLTVPKEIVPLYEELKDHDLSIEVKRYRPKRSLDANAYAWVLMGKLAAVLGIAPVEVYREAIRSIGDNFEIVPIRNDAMETWVKNWQQKGLGWICESLGDSKIEGYTNVICYYGSSTYDSKQMSLLIDAIVSGCKENGIETLTPDELARMVDRWS